MDREQKKIKHSNVEHKKRAHNKKMNWYNFYKRKK